MVEEVFPEFSHNPTVIGPTPDGYYLLFMLSVQNKTVIADCTHSVPNSTVPHEDTRAGRIVMAWSKSPKGPWESRTILRNDDKPTQNRTDWDCWLSNPSAIVLGNGSVMLVVRGRPCDHFEEALAVAFAPHWNGTFVQDSTPVWRKPGPAIDPPAQGVGNVEDPFLWVDARGNYHIVAHSQGNTNVCGGGREVSNACGIHFFATSERGPWTASQTAVYTDKALLTNGTLAGFTTRQRPQIIFAEDGVTPHYMVQGCNFDGFNSDPNAHQRTCFFEFKTSQTALV